MKCAHPQLKPSYLITVRNSHHQSPQVLASIIVVPGLYMRPGVRFPILNLATFRGKYKSVALYIVKDQNAVQGGGTKSSR